MTSASTEPVQIGGRMITVTLLRLLEPSIEAVCARLDQRLRGAPSLAALPAVLDLEPLGAAAEGLDIAALGAQFRARALNLIGVRDAGEPARAAAQALGLPLVRMDGARLLQRGPEADGAPAARAQEPPARTLTITQPVRSGQQVYARGGDLVLLAPVSAGAEVLADGNIHAYGPLRGRAMAGVQGDGAARLYCRRLEAELVAIAGIYRLSEQIGEAERAGPVQVRLDGERLLIEPL